MGSVQLDFQLPTRFDLRYVNADGDSQDSDGQPYRPVIVHRALLGSFERFIGILLEHFEGRFPLWLAPEAVRILPVGAAQAAYAREVAERLADARVRCSVADHGPLGGRVRDAHRLRVPVIAVVGALETEAGSVALRRHGAGQQVVSLQEAVATLGEEVAERGQ